MRDMRVGASNLDDPSEPALLAEALPAVRALSTSTSSAERTDGVRDRMEREGDLSKRAKGATTNNRVLRNLRARQLQRSKYYLLPRSRSSCLLFYVVNSHILTRLYHLLISLILELRLKYLFHSLDLFYRLVVPGKLKEKGGQNMSSTECGLEEPLVPVMHDLEADGYIISSCCFFYHL